MLSGGASEGSHLPQEEVTPPVNSTLRPTRIAAAVLAAIGACATAHAKPLAGGAPLVPPGFEALLEGQLERVEVVLYGRNLGTYMATVSLEGIRFEEPERLADAVLAGRETVPEGMRVSIIQALTPMMPRNGDLACGPLTKDGCGYIDTDQAALVHDERQGVVNLFLARDWVANLDLSTRPYEEVTGGAINAFVHRQYVNFSLGENYRNVSIQGNGALGIGRSGFIGAQWSYVRAQSREQAESRFSFDNLYYRKDINQTHYVQAGRMDQRDLSGSLGGNFGFSMLPFPRFDGVRMGSTEAYRKPDETGNATPVTILLSRDARVDVLRGSELLGTQYFAAGVQAIQTTGFPPGSYPLTLRVYEDGVFTRVETAPFSKTGSASQGEGVQWFVQAGRTAIDDWGLRSGDDWDGRSVAQAGLRASIGKNLHATLGVASLAGTVYGETRLEWQHAFSAGVLSASATYFSGNDGSRGDSQLVSYSNGISLSVYRYRMRGQVCKRADVYPGDVGCYDSLNGTASFMLGNWLAMLGYTYSENRGRPLFEQPVLNPFAPPVPLLPGTSLLKPTVARTVQLGFSRNYAVGGLIVGARWGGYRTTSDTGLRIRDNGVYAGISVSRASQPPRPDGRASFAAGQVDVRKSRGNDAEMSYSASYRQSWQNGSYRELGASVSGYNDQSYAGMVTARMDGRQGDMTATLSTAHGRSGNQGQQSNLTGSYASAFAIGGRRVYWGGSNGATTPAAGLAIKVGPNDDAHGAPAAQVRGDGLQTYKLGFGESTLLPMEGYRRSFAEVSDAVSVASAANVSVASGGGMRDYFLIPGKLVIKEIQSQANFTYVGRAQDTQGRALAGAAVLNALVPNLDERGGFALDVQSQMEILYLLHEGRVLACPMKVIERRDVVQLVGVLQCVPVAASALPAHIRDLPRVVRLLDAPGQTASRAGGAPL